MANQFSINELNEHKQSKEESSRARKKATEQGRKQQSKEESSRIRKKAIE